MGIEERNVNNQEKNNKIKSEVNRFRFLKNGYIQTSKEDLEYIYNWSPGKWWGQGGGGE